MAIRWAIASGNWSSTSTWNGGTLPASDDDVYADGKNVTVNQNIIVNTLNTTQRSGGTIGGSFTINTNGIFVTASQIISGNTSAAVTYGFNVSSAQNVNIFANFINSNVPNNISAMRLVNSSVNLVGTVSCGTKFTGQTGTIYGGIISNSTLNMSGNIIGSGVSTSGVGMYVGSSVINLTGNVISGSQSSSNGILAVGNSTINVTGSVVANSAAAVRTDQFTGTINIWSNINPGGATTIFDSSRNTGTYNIFGNVTGGVSNAARGMDVNGAKVNILGNVSAGLQSSTDGIFAASGATLAVTGSVTGGINTYSNGILLDSSTASIWGNVTGGTPSGNMQLGSTEQNRHASHGVFSRGSSILTINGDIRTNATNLFGGAGSSGLKLSSTGLTIINGNVYSFGIIHDNPGNLIINGEQKNDGKTFPGSINSGWQAISRYASSGNLTINGNIIGATSGGVSYYIYDVSTNKTITINGNMTQQTQVLGYLAYMGGSSTLNVNGNVSGGGTSSIYSISSAPINITGNVTAGASYSAVISTNTNQVTTIIGNINNTSEWVAYYGTRLVVGNSNTINMTLQSQNGTNRILSSTSSSNNVPLAKDVRLGTQFGTSNEFTGTLAMPTASSVSLGVPVDNTTGVAILNANDVGALLAGFII